MKFPYLKFPTKDPREPWVARPIIPVILETSNKPSVAIMALVDSGADRCLFHADIGRDIGLKITDGMPHNFSGIEGGKVQTYLHKVSIQIVGDSHSVEVIAGFCESQGIGAILGQEGFFDAFKITLHRSKDRIEIV